MTFIDESFAASTRRYQRWMRQETPIDADALETKHTEMRKGFSAFLRATFYRWSMQWPCVCGDLADAPRVLAVGDLHVDNFGTWRDVEDRLVWGVNDFDEASPMPYTQDLVRLATSARFVLRELGLSISGKTLCAAILDGYGAALHAGGQPLVLAEDQKRLPNLDRLRCLAEREEVQKPTKFWRNALEKDLHQLRKPLDPGLEKLVRRTLPRASSEPRFYTRIGGLGSLGRPRVVAIAEHAGGHVGREYKRLIPSAWGWAHDRRDVRLYCADLLRTALRAADPELRVTPQWLVRRFGPGTKRLDLHDPKSMSVANAADLATLLWFMGWETANVHLGTRGARTAIRRDVAHRTREWLRRASKAMTRAVAQDFATLPRKKIRTARSRR